LKCKKATFKTDITYFAHQVKFLCPLTLRGRELCHNGNSKEGVMPPKEGVVPTQRGSYAKLNEIVHTILKEGVGAQSFAKREGVARGREGVVPQ
jgi:hypothetical protein